MCYAPEITKFVEFLLGVLFAALFVLLPISAKAQCPNWEARGDLTLMQKGNVGGIAITLEQNGKVVTGQATYSSTARGSGVFGSFKGSSVADGIVDGTIIGNQFSVQIFWGQGLTGIYNAQILPSGRLDGETYDKNNSKIRQSFYSQQVLKCPPAPLLPPVQSKPPPIKRTGRAPKSSPAEAPELKAPGIIATRPVFTSQNSPIGFVVLSWDGGPNHPYAEVWFAVNGGEQAFMVEQGKGSREVTVERGKSYTYVLTDSGKTLSTVNFVVQ